MLAGQAADLFVEAGILVGVCSLAPLLASMFVGLFFGVLQAATQVQEQSLSFIAKLLAVALVLYALGPDLADQLRQFTIEYLQRAEQLAW